jgi:hypothetical protein
LTFSGIRVVAVSQGIDTANEPSEVLTIVHGLVDSLYVKELAKKTHRGLEGKILHGFHSGGRCFGYSNVKAQDGVRLEINPVEATIVLRIFEMYATGLSLKGVAKALNAEQVPTSRPRAGKRYATWCPSGIREMLRRELYAGRIIWNQSHFVKVPGSNRRVRRERPQSEWRIIERPELRIILARQMDGGNAQPARWNLCPYVKSLSLIGFGLRGIIDGSLVEITTPPGGRGLADVDFGSCPGGVDGEGEVDFVAGANKGAQEVGEQDAATAIEVADRISGVPISLSDNATEDHLGTLT